eukprot:c39115_g1_i1.p1 GENE.c39115_g1_i1~~c39115_g1_i1.p1  ORF type:complete len:325 (+),score=49.89 c39115_g1_i1:83-1057(+)
MQSFVVLLFKFTQLKILRAHQLSHVGRVPHHRFELPSIMSRRLEFELNIPDSTFVFAGALVENLLTTRPQIFMELSAAEIVVSCCLLAIKYLGEMKPRLSSLSEVVKMTTKHLAWLERKIFQSLNFNAHVSLDAYATSAGALMAMSNTAFICLCLNDPFGVRASDRPLRRLDALEREIDNPPRPRLPPIDSVLGEQRSKKRPRDAEETSTDCCHFPNKRQELCQTWDDKDDARLQTLVHRHGLNNQWSYIALFFESRSPNDCSLRYSELQAKSVKNTADAAPSEGEGGRPSPNQPEDYVSPSVYSKLSDFRVQRICSAFQEDSR